MHQSSDLGALLGLSSARAQLDVGIRGLWGPGVDVTRCEVVHLDRSLDWPTQHEATQFSLRLALHDQRDHSFTEALVHGSTERDGGRRELRLRRFPDDPAMPHLDEMVDVQRLSRRFPADVADHLGTGAPTIAVIDFRPGTRCTLRVDARRSAFATTFNDGRAARIAQCLEALTPQLAQSSALAWQRCLGHDGPTRTVWIEALQDVRSFIDYPPRRGAVRASWPVLGRALSELHHAGTSEVEAASRASRLARAEVQVAVLERAACPSARLARAIVEMASQEANRLPVPRDVLVNGRLRAGTLGRLGDRVVMQDVLGIGRGEPEHDFATLLVSLESLGIGRAALSRALEQMTEGYLGAGPHGVERATLAWHYRLQLVEQGWRDYRRNGALSFGRITSLLRRAHRSGPLEATWSF